MYTYICKNGTKFKSLKEMESKVFYSCSPATHLPTLQRQQLLHSLNIHKSLISSDVQSSIYDGQNMPTKKQILGKLLVPTEAWP